MPQILIIQDEPLYNEYLCSHFERIGLKARSVLNTQEAMEFLKIHTPSVIISEEVKMFDEFEKLPCAVIVLAREDQTLKIAKALQSGALDFCIKNNVHSFIEKSLAWVEIGESIRYCKINQRKLIDLFREKCSSFQEAV